MKTLSEHNIQRRLAIKDRESTAHLTDVACDQCGKEMHYVDPGSTNLDYPSTRWVKCPECNQPELMVV